MVWPETEGLDSAAWLSSTLPSIYWGNPEKAGLLSEDAFPEFHLQAELGFGLGVLDLHPRISCLAGLLVSGEIVGVGQGESEIRIECLLCNKNFFGGAPPGRPMPGKGDSRGVSWFPPPFSRRGPDYTPSFLILR